MSSPRNTVWTILDEGTTSSGIELGPESIIGAILPADAGITGTKLTIQGSMDGSTYYTIYNDDTPLELTVQTAASMHLFSPDKTHGARWLRVVSDATESSGPITITPVYRRYF